MAGTAQDGGPTLIHDIEHALLTFIENTYDAIEWPGVVLRVASESASISVSTNHGHRTWAGPRPPIEEA